MKTLVTIFWSGVFAVLAAKQGVCQQATETTPPAEATITGVISTLTRGFNIVLSVPEENGRTHDLTITTPEDVKISMDGSAAKEDDLRIGKAVVVACTTQNMVPGTNNVPADKTTGRTAKGISIIFDDSSLPMDKNPVQQQPSPRIPAEFIGSWISIVRDSIQKIQITTNHIQWKRDVNDPQEIYDSISYKLNAKGDLSFDTKLFLTSDVSTNTTVMLKIRDGRFFLRVLPVTVDAGAAKLSNPGEERIYFRDRTPASSENKPSSAK